MNTALLEEKPKLRGYFHQEAFFVALGACLMLIFQTESRISLVAAIVYTMGLLVMLGISAIYHRFHWQPKPKAILRRLDHSAIFIVIASTATPFCIFALSEEAGREFLMLIWAAALAGVAQSVAWNKAPRFLSLSFYFIMGGLSLPYVYEMQESLGLLNILLVIIGSFIICLGAMSYALKWPKISPHFFGYHELFHISTIIGFTMHFIVVYQLIV